MLNCLGGRYGIKRRWGGSRAARPWRCPCQLIRSGHKKQSTLRVGSQKRVRLKANKIAGTSGAALRQSRGFSPRLWNPLPFNSTRLHALLFQHSSPKTVLGGARSYGITLGTVWLTGSFRRHARKRSTAPSIAAFQCYRCSRHSSKGDIFRIEASFSGGKSGLLVKFPDFRVELVKGGAQK
jgi:hypothetical protein